MALTQLRSDQVKSLTAGQIEGISYHHIQPTTSIIWSIVHNLNKFPVVTVVDSTGDEVIGDITHTSLNALTAIFSQAISGQAYLS